MIIVKYTTEEEAQQIITEKESEGYTLVEVANIEEGNFLGFMKNPIPQPTPIEEKINSIQNTVDIILLKQEGIL